MSWRVLVQIYSADNAELPFRRLQGRRSLAAGDMLRSLVKQFLACPVREPHRILRFLCRVSLSIPAPQHQLKFQERLSTYVLYLSFTWTLMYQTLHNLLSYVVRVLVIMLPYLQ